MDKPVIIIGGGLTGSLLAYRLKSALPSVSFLLYEKTSKLGGQQTTGFCESDCLSSMAWLKPLVSHTWKQHQIKFRTFEKWITSPFHLLHPDQLHQVISEKVGEDLRLCNELSLEQALQDGSFVIDARNSSFYKSLGYRKFLSLELELQEDHHLIAPVTLDASVALREQFRFLSYYPVGERRLVVRDVWLSDNKKLDTSAMLQSVTDAIRENSWKIAKVIREETGIQQIPVSSPVIREHSRVINLSALSHDFTGCSLPLITALIDRMVKTSFRYGELKDVVKRYREEFESNQKFFRSLNHQLILKKKSRIFEQVYSQSYPVLERFSRGNLGLLDRPRISLSAQGLQISHLLQVTKPMSLQPKYV